MLPQPTREQLLRDLTSWGPEADVAAITLADRGDNSALPEILRSILRECGMEHIPDARIDSFVRLAGPEHVRMLAEELEQLDEAELELDAGDTGDEFWRIQTAIERIMVGIGPRALDPVQIAQSSTQNRFALESLSRVIRHLTGEPVDE